MEKRRFTEFDLAKTIAILGLPFVHFLELAINCNFLKTEVYSLAEAVIFFTVFGPALFMLCMGFGMSGSYSYKRTIKTGVHFIIIGYVLNFLIFPFLALMLKLLGVVDYTYRCIFMNIVGADIYVFVGWYNIFLGVMRKYKASNFAVTTVCILLLAVNSITSHKVYLDESFLSVFLGNFFTVNALSYFPLAGWALFPTIGLVLGNYVKSIPAEKYRLLAKRVLIFSVAAFVSLISGLYAYGVSPFDILVSFTENYTMDLFTAFQLVFIAIIVICTLYFIYYSVRPNAAESFLLRLAPLIMPFYLIQWLVTTFVTYYVLFLGGLPEESLGILWSVVIMLLIWTVSVLLTFKKGLSFIRFVLKKTDYTKWFRRKTPDIAE